MKKDNPLISVIVPVYNVEKYLDRCIESIANQTYKNLEIILVDDGSPDNCPKICGKWAKKDKRIKVIHKENGGVSSARNIGIDDASGDYIGFVDSDDFIEKNMYGLMLKKIESTDSDGCFCDVRYIGTSSTEEIHLWKKTKFKKNEMLSNFFDYNGINFSVCNKLFRRDKLNNIRFNEKIFIKEDALFCIEYYNNTETICRMDKALYNYCFNANSTLNTKNIKKELTSLDATSKIINILKKNNINIYLNEECNYVGRFYKYKYDVEKEKLNIDISTYEKQVMYYLREGLLKKKVGFKNKLKILLSTKFNKLYISFIKIRDKVRKFNENKKFYKKFFN